MSKCICKQIADMVEKKGCDKIQICTGHSGICGYVDVDATKDADGILVVRNAKMKPYTMEGETKTAECVGISGLHIVAFNCEDFEDYDN